MGAPINRAPFNALIDDNGTGLTGTLWGKDDIKDVLLDPIDVALAGAVAYPLSIGSALYVPLAAGTYHNLNPGGAVAWTFEPAGPVTITGLIAQADGMLHLLVNATGQPITLPNGDTGSTAGNRFIGPGFATFVLGTWKSVWVIYNATRYSAWIILGSA